MASVLKGSTVRTSFCCSRIITTDTDKFFGHNRFIGSCNRVIKTMGYSEPIRRDWLLIAAATLPGSSQANTDEFFGHNIWVVTIDIKSNTRIPVVSRRGAKVWRRLVTTPAATLLVAIAGVAGHVEPGVEGVVTDQQLVRVRAVCEFVGIPQSLWLSGVAVAIDWSNISTRSSREILFFPGPLIDEDYFRKLQTRHFLA